MAEIYDIVFEVHRIKEDDYIQNFKKILHSLETSQVGSFTVCKNRQFYGLELPEKNLFDTLDIWINELVNEN